MLVALFAPGGGIDTLVEPSDPSPPEPAIAPAPAIAANVTPTTAPTIIPTPTSEPTPTRTAAIDADDGAIVEGEEPSPLDSTQPALAGLDPDLLAAVQMATKDAEAEGIQVVVTSGWRSPEYQQSLLEEAIGIYGRKKPSNGY